MLGFTLGGYAILLAFGNVEFLETLLDDENEENDTKSIYIAVNVTFIHFIVVQIITIIISIISLSWSLSTGIIACIGLIIFVYAIMTAAASAFALLRLARMYKIYIEINKKIEKSKSEK